MPCAVTTDIAGVWMISGTPILCSATYCCGADLSWAGATSIYSGFGCPPGPSCDITFLNTICLGSATGFGATAIGLVTVGVGMAVGFVVDQALSACGVKAEDKIKAMQKEIKDQKFLLNGSPPIMMWTDIRNKMQEIKQLRAPANHTMKK